MNDFVQMDIFFFIASVACVVILIFAIVVGIYLFIIVKKIKTIIKEFQNFTVFATSEGKKSIGDIKSKIDEILNSGGIVERMIVTTLGTILAKTFKSHGKIKKEAPKKK